MDPLGLKVAIPQAEAAADRLVAKEQDAIQSAGGQLIDKLTTSGDELDRKIEASIVAAGEQLLDRVAGLLTQQDGWTLSIHIPIITIRLNKPAAPTPTP